MKSVLKTINMLKKLKCIQQVQHLMGKKTPMGQAASMCRFRGCRYKKSKTGIHHFFIYFNLITYIKHHQVKILKSERALLKFKSFISLCIVTHSLILQKGRSMSSMTYLIIYGIQRYRTPHFHIHFKLDWILACSATQTDVSNLNYRNYL